MKVLLKDAAVYGLLFAAVAIVLIIIGIPGTGPGDGYGAFADPVFPEVSFTFMDMETRSLRGYSDEADSNDNASFILPTDGERMIKLNITGYSSVPEGIYIMLRDSSKNRLIDRTPLQMEHADGVMHANYRLSALTLENELYYLTIIVDDREVGEIYYTIYTACYTEEFYKNKEQHLKLATDFADAAVAGDREFLSTYISYDESKALKDLSHVNMFSGNTLMTWAGLAPVMSDRRVDIFQWTKEQTGLRLSYRLHSDEGGDLFVEEDFVIRSRGEKLYLLDYDRRTREIFSMDDGNVGNTSILLGVCDSSDTDLISTDNGQNIYFTVDGGVYRYSYQDNELKNIFSFGETNTHTRIDRNGYDLRLLGVADERIYFAIAGYQAAGRHEGQTGIAVYSYSPDKDETAERFWTRLHGRCEDALDVSGKLCRVSGSGLMFINIGGCIYTMDLTGNEPVKARDDIEAGSIFVSSDGVCAAWPDRDDGCIRLLETENDVLSTVTSDKELYLAGFVGNDIVYLEGSGRVRTVSGFDVIQYYDSLVIAGTDGVAKTRYHRDGVFIKGVTLTEYGVIIERDAYTDGRYVSMENDILGIASVPASDGTVSIRVAASEIKRDYYYINLGRTIPQSKKLVISQAEFSATAPATVNYAAVNGDKKYMAWVLAEPAGRSDDLLDAIRTAWDRFGTVRLDAEFDRVIWDRDAKEIYTTIKLPEMSWTKEGQEEVLNSMSQLERALDIMAYAGLANGAVSNQVAKDHGKQGFTQAAQELEYIFGDRMIVIRELNTSYITHYLSAGHPVMALPESVDNAKLITGYTQNDVRIYDPATRESSNVKTEDISAVFGGEAVVLVSWE